jgi:hypothetical protein
MTPGDLVIAFGDTEKSMVSADQPSGSRVGSDSGQIAIT